MGWTSGSVLMARCVSAVLAGFPDDLALPARRAAYVKMILAFGDHDCDTLEECLGSDPAFDLAFRDTHPEHDGFASRREGRALSSCPYPDGGAEAAHWRLGWTRADDYESHLEADDSRRQQQRTL